MNIETSAQAWPNDFINGFLSSFFAQIRSFLKAGQEKAGDLALPNQGS